MLSVSELQAEMLVGNSESYSGAQPGTLVKPQGLGIREAVDTN